jgi:hypothetical protein
MYYINYQITDFRQPYPPGVDAFAPLLFPPRQWGFISLFHFVDVLNFDAVGERHGFIRADANKDGGERDIITDWAWIGAPIYGAAVIQVTVVFGAFGPLVNPEAARGKTIGDGFGWRGKHGNILNMKYTYNIIYIIYNINHHRVNNYLHFFGETS